MLAFSFYSSTNDISGVKTWLENFIQDLSRSGEDIVLNLHHLGENPQASNFLRFDTTKNVRVFSTTVPKTGHAAVIHTLEFLNATQPAVFIPQALPAPHFAAKWAENHGLPWVLTMHSDDPAYWSLVDALRPAKGKGAIVAVSASIAAQVTSRYPDTEVTVIPCGVAIPEQHVTWNNAKFRIVFSGRLLERQKRISKVMETLIAACNMSDKLEAVIIGDGTDKAKVEAMVANARLSNRIRFTGRLSARQVENELLQAQAIILMSDYEGLPVALLEGMAFGLVPVVRNIRSGIPEIVHHATTGILVDDQPANVAKELVALANNQEQWQVLSRNARTLVCNDFSRDACFNKWHVLLTALASQSHATFPIPTPSPATHPGFFRALQIFEPRKTSALTMLTNKLRQLAKSIKGSILPAKP